MAAKMGLGRGLDLLIPSEPRKSASIKKEETVSRSVESKPETANQNLEDKQDNKQENKANKVDNKSESDSNNKLLNKTNNKAENKIDTEIDKQSDYKTNNRTENQLDVLQRNETSKVNDASQIDENKKDVETIVMGHTAGTTEVLVDIKLIEPNHEQPRKQFDEDSLLELSESIKQFGIIQPLLVQQKEGYYEIVAGERRWRAAKIAGLKEVPVIIKSYSLQEILEISLIENLQREDLNPIEEAASFRRLIDEFHLTQEDVAERVSKSRTAVTNSMRLLKLDQRVQQMLVDDMITSGHARAILAIEDGEEQLRISMKVFDDKLSVREVEKLVKGYLNPTKEKEEKSKNDFLYKELEERIKNILGTKVVIKNQSNNKGKIELQYYSQDELERIIELIQSIHG